MSTCSTGVQRPLTALGCLGSQGAGGARNGPWRSGILQAEIKVSHSADVTTEIYATGP